MPGELTAVHWLGLLARSQSLFRLRAKQNTSTFSGKPLPETSNGIRPKMVDYCVFVLAWSVFPQLKMLSCLVSLWLLLSRAAGEARLLHVIGICAQWTQTPLLLSGTSL